MGAPFDQHRFGFLPSEASTEIPIRRRLSRSVLRLSRESRGYLLEFRKYFPVAGIGPDAGRAPALRPVRLLHEGDTGADGDSGPGYSGGGTRSRPSNPLVRLRHFYGGYRLVHLLQTDDDARP